MLAVKMNMESHYLTAVGLEQVLKCYHETLNLVSIALLRIS